jgi:energy-coupling factor transporter transmembrane protein EcfT
MPKLKMHHKLILALVFVAVGCFLTVKYSIWFIIVPLIFFSLIFLITKQKELLKIVVPVGALMIAGALIFNVSGYPSAEELKSKLSIYETDLVTLRKSLKEREVELEKAKKEQGWLKSAFKDSEKVNHLEKQVDFLQGEIAALEKNIYNLKNQIRKKE